MADVINQNDIFLIVILLSFILLIVSLLCNFRLSVIQSNDILL